MHYLDCTAPFQLQFVTNGIAQDTKATGTDQPQRGILLFLIVMLMSNFA